MKPTIVALMLAAVMLAGCTFGPGPGGDDEPTTPAVEQPSTPETPSSEAPPAVRIVWDDIPVAEYTSQQPMRINATPGLNLLRVQLQDTVLQATFSANTTSDHLAFVHEGYGPFDPDADCQTIADPVAASGKVGHLNLIDEAFHGTRDRGEYLVLISTPGTFQAVLHFGPVRSAVGSPYVTPLTVEGTIESMDNSTERSRTGTTLDDFQAAQGMLVIVGAKATQDLGSNGTIQARDGDNAGTLRVVLEDTSGCLDGETDEVHVQTTDTGTTTVRSVAGPLIGRGDLLTGNFHYDMHDGSEDAQLKWTFAGFLLPDIHFDS